MVLSAECVFFPPHHHWNHTFKRHLQDGSPTLLVQKRTNALRKVVAANRSASCLPQNFLQHPSVALPPIFTLHRALHIGLFKLVKDSRDPTGLDGGFTLCPQMPCASLKCLCSFLPFKAHIH